MIPKIPMSFAEIMEGLLGGERAPEIDPEVREELTGILENRLNAHVGSAPDALVRELVQTALDGVRAGFVVAQNRNARGILP